jgi:hypothetical protein
VADPADHPIQPLPSAQLLLYRFGPDAEFEGRLVGALERIESGGGLRVLDAIFVRRDPDTSELAAFAAHGDGADRRAAARLPARRHEAPARHRARARAGDRADTVHKLAAELGQGEAMAAVLVEHVWAIALEDAVARTGGTLVTSEFVGATALSELPVEQA